jgi:hypothetical protein
MKWIPGRADRPMAWALLAVLALPAILAASLCQDCGECPIETRAETAGCHGPDEPRLVANCCASLAAPAPASDRVPTATQVSGVPQVSVPVISIWEPRPETAAPLPPAATPPDHGVRLHTLFSVYLI